MAQALPVEILDGIASFTRKKDLLNLSLTCKLLYDVTMPHMWEDIRGFITFTYPVDRPGKVAVVKWSVGGFNAPSEDQLCHVRRLEIASTLPGHNTNAIIPFVDQADAHATISQCLRVMSKLEAFRFDHCDLLMMPCLISALQKARCLTELAFTFPEPRIFPTASIYEETVRCLQQLGSPNLEAFEISTNPYEDAVATMTVAYILFNSPNIRVLKVGTYEKGYELEHSDQDLDRVNESLSKICTEFAKIKQRSKKAADPAAQQENGSDRRLSSGMDLLSLEEIVLGNSCLLGPEIYLLTDTSFLKRLEVANYNCESEGDHAYYGRTGSLQTLAGRAPNLESVTFDSDFNVRYDVHEVVFSRDFPSLSELVVWEFRSSVGFMDAMEACGGTGIGAQRWEKLVLSWGDNKPDHPNKPMAHPMILFLAECTNLTHLDMDIKQNYWDQFLSTVAQLKHMRELYLFIELDWNEPLNRSDSDAAQELFNCNLGLEIVMVSTSHNHDEYCRSLWWRMGTKFTNQFWKRGQSKPYFFCDGETRLRDFPPKNRLTTSMTERNQED